MKVLLGKYHEQTCCQFQEILEENGIYSEIDIAAEAVEFDMMNIIVAEEDLEMAQLVINSSEAFSEKLIEEKLKPEIKNEFKKALFFLIAVIVLSTVLLPLLDSNGTYEPYVMLGVFIVIARYFIRQGKKQS